MSSILKALKKAEKEGAVYKTSPGLTLNVQRLFENASETVDENTSSPLKFLIPGICILLVVSGAALYFFFFRSLPAPGPIATKTPTPAHLPAPSKSPKPKSSTPTIPVAEPAAQITPPTLSTSAAPQARPAPPLPKKLNPETEPSFKAAPPRQSMPDQQSEKPVERLKPEEPKPLTAKAQNNVQQQTPTKQTEPAPAAVEPVQKPAQPEKTTLPIKTITDGSLKIHAISWAENSSQRIVVLNSRVAGENEQIEGYTIIKIEKNGVRLRKEGTMYWLGFENK